MSAIVVRSGQVWADAAGHLALVRVARDNQVALLYRSGSCAGDRRTVQQPELLAGWRLHFIPAPCAVCGTADVQDCDCSCDCATYEPCAGECCGVGNCTCTPGLGEIYDDEKIGVFPL